MVILEGSNSIFGGFSGHMRAVGVVVVMVCVVATVPPVVISGERLAASHRD